MKCITTIATANHAYYYAAFNLALSLKYHGCKIPFVLICDAGNNYAHIRKEHRDVFDEVVFLNGIEKTPFYSKTLIYDKIPEKYTEVMFVDADSLALRDPEQLFSKLSDETPFLAMTEKAGTFGHHNIVMSWAKIEDIYTYYDFPKDRVFTEINSSIMLFRRSKLADDIFRLAEHYYAEDYFAPSERLGGHYPDELAFETAFLATNYKLPDFRPLFIHYASDKRSKPVRLPKMSGYFLSLPGYRNHTARYCWVEYQKYFRNWMMNYGLSKHGSKTYYGNGYKFAPEMKAANGINAPVGGYKGLRPNEGQKWVDELLKEYSQPN